VPAHAHVYNPAVAMHKRPALGEIRNDASLHDA
jgi:hypothetical protein